MCSPSGVDKPAPVQEAKQPDLNAILKARRKKNGTVEGGTLLTDSGVSNNTNNTGATTLLGG